MLNQRLPSLHAPTFRNLSSTGGCSIQVSTPSYEPSSVIWLASVYSPLQRHSYPLGSANVASRTHPIHEARTWPFPQSLGTGSPQVHYLMPGIDVPDPNLRIPRACTHKSMKVIPYIGQSPEYLDFRSQAIKWIKSRLEVSPDNTSDEMIGIIMFLIYSQVSVTNQILSSTRATQNPKHLEQTGAITNTSFKVERGSTQECDFHLNALERIVKLRGGIEKFTQDHHLQAKLSMFAIKDLSHLRL